MPSVKKTPLKPPHPRARRLPRRRQLDETLAGLMAHPDVIGCFIGHKRSGREISRRLAIVCLVKRKLLKNRLSTKRMLPDRVAWQLTPNRTSSLPIDVIEVKKPLVHQSALLGPGDQIPAATIGIALRHPQFGPVVTTAGHAVPAPGAILSAQSGGQAISARAVRVTRNERTDHALLHPEPDSPIGNFFRDVSPLGPLHVPDPEHDVGTALWVLPANRDPLPTVCRGVNGQVLTDQGIVMLGLIVTDAVTLGGDSGACLVDSAWRIWGLLVGRFVDSQQQREFSAFVPANRVVFLENAELF